MVFVAECALCGGRLAGSDVAFCFSCAAFLTWKYGSVEAYLRLLDAIAHMELKEVE